MFIVAHPHTIYLIWFTQLRSSSKSTYQHPYVTNSKKNIYNIYNYTFHSFVVVVSLWVVQMRYPYFTNKQRKKEWLLFELFKPEWCAHRFWASHQADRTNPSCRLSDLGWESHHKQMTSFVASRSVAHWPNHEEQY